MHLDPAKFAAVSVGRASSRVRSAMVRLLVCLGLIAAAGFAPGRWWPIAPGISGVLAAIAVVVAMLLAIDRVSFRYWAIRVALFLPPWLFAALSLQLAHGWKAGGLAALALMSRGVVSFSALIWLSATTRIDDLLAALLRLGVPWLLVSVIGFLHRYLFVLADELRRMRRARRARCFDQGRQRWKETASLLGMLFVRSHDRARRVHAAMLARGYGPCAPVAIGDTAAAGADLERESFTKPRI